MLSLAPAEEGTFFASLAFTGRHDPLASLGLPSASLSLCLHPHLPSSPRLSRVQIPLFS